MVELNNQSIQDREQWSAKGYYIADFNRAAIVEKTAEKPIWVHFGDGNIFRAFIAMLQQNLIEKGIADRGIIVAEGYDYEIIDKVDRKNDSLSILVTLKNNGQVNKTVVSSITESLKLARDSEDFNRLKKIFSEDSLQLASFTITEKGYSLKDKNGKILPNIEIDFQKGPRNSSSYIGKITSLCYERYLNNKGPLALVSMDNCAENGKKLKEAVSTFAYKWYENGLVPKEFYEYINDGSKISFPWTMIDKITPRPSEEIEDILLKDEIDNTEIIKTSKNTFISNFVNSEEAEYLVIEDDFPNGRPKLEKAGVIFTSREQVTKVEKMKVGTCLNPVHTALAIFGCLLSYKTIHEEMADDDLKRFVENMVFKESIKVVEASEIIDPKDFVNDVLYNRLPNPFIPDTPQRIATDTSKKIGIRFGGTIKAYCSSKELAVKELEYIPFVIAAWCRYLLGINDQGERFEISPDPMIESLCAELKNVSLGMNEEATRHIKPILSNTDIFEIDLYEIGLGEKIERYFIELIKEKGQVRKMLEEVVRDNDK